MITAYQPEPYKKVGNKLLLFNEKLYKTENLIATKQCGCAIIVWVRISTPFSCVGKM